MTPGRHRQVGELFHAALQLPREERKAFLTKACIIDESLRLEVESLLSFEDEGKDFLKSNWISRTSEPHPENRDPSREDRPAMSKSGYDRAISPGGKPSNQAAYLLVAAFIGLLVIGAILLSVALFQKNAPSESGLPVSVASTGRSLSYSITVLRRQERNNVGKSLPFSPDMVLSEGDQLRFHISTNQHGFLYIVNERPRQFDRARKYNALFPETPGSTESSELGANQTRQIPAPSERPDLDWFVLDEQSGTERIWIIWSKQPVPLLEGIKVWVNSESKGEIGDPALTKALAEYFGTQQVITQQRELRSNGSSTDLGVPGDLLVTVVDLDHR